MPPACFGGGSSFGGVPRSWPLRLARAEHARTTSAAAKRKQVARPVASTAWRIRNTPVQDPSPRLKIVRVCPPLCRKHGRKPIPGGYLWTKACRGAPRQPMSGAPIRDAPPVNPPRERIFNIPGVVLALTALLLVIHLVVAYLLTEQSNELLSLFAFSPLRYMEVVPRLAARLVGSANLDIRQLRVLPRRFQPSLFQSGLVAWRSARRSRAGLDGSAS